MRDLDGCWVWYTDDSAAEADIESMASVASVDSREVGLVGHGMSQLLPIRGTVLCPVVI